MFFIIEVDFYKGSGKGGREEKGRTREVLWKRIQDKENMGRSIDRSTL